MINIFFRSTIFSLLFFWALGLIMFNHTINNYQIDSKIKTDAIVVLTGGRNRISEAANLLNKDLSDKLFISGVQKDISLETLYQRGDFNILPGGTVYIENKSANTVENAIEAAAWISKNNIKSIRLVTSNYHIPRSMQEFAFYNPGLKIIPHPVFSENVSKNIFKSWGSFVFIFSEYNKFLYVYTTINIKSTFRKDK